MNVLRGGQSPQVATAVSEAFSRWHVSLGKTRVASAVLPFSHGGSGHSSRGNSVHNRWRLPWTALGVVQESHREEEVEFADTCQTPEASVAVTPVSIELQTSADEAKVSLGPCVRATLLDSVGHLFFEFAFKRTSARVRAYAVTEQSAVLW